MEIIFYVENFEEEEKKQLESILKENGCSHVRIRNWEGEAQRLKNGLMFFK